eukprot:1335844-Pyramimonas_sp.AAC.1
MSSSRLPTRGPCMRGSREARARPSSCVLASLAWMVAGYLKAPRAIILQRLRTTRPSSRAGTKPCTRTVRTRGRR